MHKYCLGSRHRLGTRTSNLHLHKGSNSAWCLEVVITASFVVAILCFIPSANATTGAASHDAALAELYQKIDEVEDRFEAKLDFDNQTVGQSFYWVHFIDSAGWLSDIVNPIRETFNDVLSAFSSIISFREHGIPETLHGKTNNIVETVNFVHGLATLERRGDDLISAWQGPYDDPLIADLFDNADERERHGGPDGFTAAFEDYFEQHQIIRVPDVARGRFPSSVIRGTGSPMLDLSSIRARIAGIAPELSQASIEQATAELDRLKRSLTEAWGKNVTLDIDGKTLSLGSIGAQGTTHGKYANLYANELDTRMVQVGLETASTIGDAVSIKLTLDGGSGLFDETQTSVLLANGLAWDLIESTQTISAKELFNGLPEMMFFGLGNEVTATWEVTERVLNRVVTDLERSIVDDDIELPAPSLTLPADGSEIAREQLEFRWSSVPGANRYWLTVATTLSALPTDPDVRTCDGCTISCTVSATDHLPGSGCVFGRSEALSPGARYFWQVQAWHTDGTNGAYAPPRNFRSVGSGHLVSASGTPGGVVIPSSNTVSSGAVGVFLASADDGYERAAAVGGSCPLGYWEGSLYRTGAVAADCSVEFAFFPSSGGGDEYRVHASSGAGGSVTPGEQRIRTGGIALFDVTAEPGYALGQQVTGDCPAGQWIGNRWSTGLIEEDCDLGFAFDRLADTHQVTVVQGLGGSVSPGGVRTVTEGERLTLVVSAQPGFAPNLDLDGTCGNGHWEGVQWTSDPIDDDCEVQFYFDVSENTHQVVAWYGRGGSVLPDWRQTVTEGSSASFRVRPDPGYRVSSQVAGSCPGGFWSDDIWTTGTVYGDCEVELAFEEHPGPYQVSVVSGANGSTSPSGQAPLVARGQSLAIQAIPEPGYVPRMAVGGDCPQGSWSDQVWETGPLLGDCDVVIQFEPEAGSPIVRLLSRSMGGEQGNASSFYTDMTPDGRFVVFASNADNLVSNDTNHTRDIFVVEVDTAEIERVSVSGTGGQANGRSSWPAISDDGRFVVFESQASNLTDNDSDDITDVFLRDREAGTTRLVSYSTHAGKGNDRSQWPDISADGRFVVFESKASNLVRNDELGKTDIFVLDTQSNPQVLERVSVSSSGVEGTYGSQFGSISADGRHVAFWSGADNLVNDDSNDEDDIFLRDRERGTTELVSLTNSGDQIDQGVGPRVLMSADGNLVAFTSEATDVVHGDANGVRDIFVRDRSLGTTFRVTLNQQGEEANGASDLTCSIFSPTGRFLTFRSNATNLVENGTSELGIYVNALEAGEVAEVHVTDTGGSANGGACDTSVSGDGRYVAFSSNASNLVPGDTNGSADIFLWDRQGTLPPDTDGDGLLDRDDNCPNHANPGQEDMDADNIGDRCDADLDGDGIDNSADNCELVANVSQADADGDGNGDACDDLADRDRDTIRDLLDNCPTIANQGQENTDGDSLGNACDPDDDGDGVNDESDAFPLDPTESHDTDQDGIGNNADADDDNDGILDDAPDNCPLVANPSQRDRNLDGIGDACDPLCFECLPRSGGWRAILR